MINTNPLLMSLFCKGFIMFLSLCTRNFVTIIFKELKKKKYDKVCSELQKYLQI